MRFEKATEREREYMAAMADLGEGPYRTPPRSPGVSASERLTRRLHATH